MITKPSYRFVIILLKEGWRFKSKVNDIGFGIMNTWIFKSCI